MHSLLTWISRIAFAALGLFLIAFGTLYATVGNMLPFHAAAVPEASREAILPLYVALMTLIGGASAALGALGLYVTFGPMRKGASGAAFAVACAYAAAFLTAAFVAERLAAAAGAPTSWHIMGGLMAATAVALGADIASRQLKST
jgi:hypothetical protein